MKIQGSGAPVQIPQTVHDVGAGKGPQVGGQPAIDQQPVEQTRQAGLTADNFPDGYEGIKAGKASGLEPRTQLPELDMDALGELGKEVKQKLEEAHRGKRKGGKKAVAEDEEDADGDGIPDVNDATPSTAD